MAEPRRTNLGKRKSVAVQADAPSEDSMAITEDNSSSTNSKKSKTSSEDPVPTGLAALDATRLPVSPSVHEPSATVSSAALMPTSSERPISLVYLVLLVSSTGTEIALRCKKTTTLQKLREKYRKANKDCPVTASIHFTPIPGEHRIPESIKTIGDCVPVYGLEYGEVWKLQVTLDTVTDDDIVVCEGI